jgi:alkylation response protein AidB-like acyl-CoA dehydrogenase
VIAPGAIERDAGEGLGSVRVHLWSRRQARTPPLSACAPSGSVRLRRRWPTDAVQLFSGAGCSREAGIERLMRDAKDAQIKEGTNQLHRGVVADLALGRSWVRRE